MHHAKHFLMLEIASDIKYQCAKLFNHYLKEIEKKVLGQDVLKNLYVDLCACVPQFLSLSD